MFGDGDHEIQGELVEDWTFLVDENIGQAPRQAAPPCPLGTEAGESHLVTVDSQPNDPFEGERFLAALGAPLGKLGIIAGRSTAAGALVG